MKLKKGATIHEFFDERGRRFDVRLNVGMRVGVVIYGPREESIEWRGEWGRYLPQSEATARALIEEFFRRQDRRQPLERINAELAYPGREPKRVACACADDRQLPAGDRV